MEEMNKVLKDIHKWSDRVMYCAQKSRVACNEFQKDIGFEKTTGR